jgi:hypothetical protein
VDRLTDEFINEGLIELREYLRGLEAITEITDTIDISTESTLEFLLQSYSNKGRIVFIDFGQSPISYIANNSKYNLEFKPRLSIQIFSAIYNKEAANRKYALKILTRLMQYLNGAITTNFGKITIQQNSNITPLTIYDGTGQGQFWGLEFILEGTVKLNSSIIEEA